MSKVSSSCRECHSYSTKLRRGTRMQAQGPASPKLHQENRYWQTWLPSTVSLLRQHTRRPGRTQSSARERARRRLLSLAAADSDTVGSELRTWFHRLQDGVNLEVISGEARKTNTPPLIFIHGAGHGAWCWKEQFLPYLQSKGYSCHAISLRAQAGSDKPVGAKSGGTLAQHADDVSNFIEANLKQKPIIVGHSFGGLVVQSYILKNYDQRKKVLGVGLLAAAPPQGNSLLVKRFFLRKPWNAIKLTWAFVTKSYLRKSSAARFLLFSDDLPDHLVDRYTKLLRENRSPIPAVDAKALKKEVPLPDPTPATPPVFVLGGDQDIAIDVEGVQETAQHYNVEPLLLTRMAHDVMLDTRWYEAADGLERWVASLKNE